MVDVKEKEVKTCFCCKKDKEGSYVVYDTNPAPTERWEWVCNDCNHLEKKK